MCIGSQDKDMIHLCVLLARRQWAFRSWDPIFGPPMTSEILCLTFEGVGHAPVGIDVPLLTVPDADEAQFERIHTSHEHVDHVHASIHQIQLGEDVNCLPGRSLLTSFMKSSSMKFRVA
jgi:hypothetical protein